MPWVQFDSDFDWRPKLGVTIGYKAGMVKLVTVTCADRSVKAGAAVKTRKPKDASGKSENKAVVPEA